MNNDVVDERFQNTVSHLSDLNDCAMELHAQGVQAARETITDVSKLIKQANSKTFRFFIDKLELVGKEVGSLTILQNAVFLKHQELYQILDKYDGTSADLLKREYLLVAQKFYLQNYTELVKRLRLKKMVPLPATPLIGNIQQTSAIGKLANRVKDALSFGKVMGDSVANRTTDSIAIKVTESDMVMAFAGVADLLYDSLHREWTFVMAFFGLEKNEADEWLRKIFTQPTASFKRRIREKFDLAANLSEVLQFLIKISTFQCAEQENSSDTIGRIFNHYSKVLRARAELLVLEQVQSIDGALLQMEKPSHIVNAVTRRATTFLIDSLNSIPIGNGPLVRLMLQPCIVAVDKFLSHSGAMIQNSRLQSIYMINNYDYLVTVLEAYCAKGVQPAFLTDLIQNYEEHLNTFVDRFVNDELRPFFPLLFEFLDSYQLGHSIPVPVDIICEFNKNAADTLRAISGSILQLFSSFRTSMFVLDAMYAQLLTAYGQFIELHDGQVGKKAAEENCPTPMTLSELEQIVRRCKNS